MGNSIICFSILGQWKVSYVTPMCIQPTIKIGNDSSWHRPEISIYLPQMSAMCWKLIFNNLKNATPAENPRVGGSIPPLAPFTIQFSNTFQRLAELLRPRFGDCASPCLWIFQNIPFVYFFYLSKNLNYLLLDLFIERTQLCLSPKTPPTKRYSGWLNNQTLNSPTGYKT